METTTINGREYTVKEMESDTPLHSASLKERGYDGKCYFLTGTRGALKMAYRNAKTGEYVLVV